jgi:hypothetical protein
MSLYNPDDFFIPEFSSSATINNISYRCIQSALHTKDTYTDYGQEDGATLFLDFALADLPSIPDAGVKITFRGVIYRTVKSTVDSANLMVKVGLISLSGSR